MRVRECLMVFIEERWHLIEHTHWHYPPNGVIKLNVDDAISKEFTTLVVVVVWDENGQILKAWAKEHILCDPLQAEVVALLWAVQLASEDEFKHIIIEGDSKT